MLFISSWKLFSSSKYIFFFYDFYVHVRKHLDYKNQVNFKIHDVTTWLKNNCNTHIDQYLRSKFNQAMTFGQLIEYNMRNILLTKSFTKCCKETKPDTFVKSQDWAYLWINILIFYIFCFDCLPSWRLSKVIQTKLQTICFYLIWSFFKKQKEVWN